ncbi:MAG: prepilin-type N-terminal cleavage/methylation domain-containing protein [Candidatus Omnitrophota bacterium]
MKIQKMLGKKGFTLVEIMIVVAIIGLLAAVAIPNFVKARENAQKNACIANLKQLEGAKTLWALDTSAANNATPGMDDLVSEYIKTTPTCPTGASYTINNIQTNPACNSGVASHTLPATA